MRCHLCFSLTSVNPLLVPSWSPVLPCCGSPAHFFAPCSVSLVSPPVSYPLPACLRRWKRAAQLWCSPLRSLQTHLQVKHSLITLMQISQGAVSTQPVKCLFYKHKDLSLFASNSMKNRHGGTCLSHQCYGGGSRRIPGAHWSDRSTGSAMADPVSKNKVEKW